MRQERLVFIPTYNERGNVETMYRRLCALDLRADFLFVDDNSPDGTGEILDEIATRDPRVTVLHRPGKQGIGGAHLDGIRWAYERAYRVLMSLDCDLTHQPEDLPRFLARKDEYDLLLSSRYMAERSLAGWTLYRRALTRAGHTLIRFLLRMPYDATTSFRLYRLDRIPRELFREVASRGYAFFFESAYLLHMRGLSIGQVPVTLPARALGRSKMGLNEVAASLRQLLRLFLERGRRTRRAAQAVTAKS